MFKVMFYGGLALAVICLILSVVLFIKNDVAKLIGDVTGWNARRAIKKLNKKGAEDVSKTEAIKTEVSKVLVHSASTTGTLQTVTNTSDKLAEPKKRRKSRRSMPEDEKTDILQQIPAPERPVREIFQPEEEMIVLAGNEETSLLADNEETSVLSGDEETSLLADNEETSVLSGDEETSLLADNEETSVLSSDEETSLLADNEETSVLSGDEETSLLADNEETSVLSGDEETSLLADNEETSVLSGNPQDAMKEATTILIREEKPLPAIFDVEEEATVVHTEESIGSKAE